METGLFSRDDPRYEYESAWEWESLLTGLLEVRTSVEVLALLGPLGLLGLLGLRGLLGIVVSVSRVLVCGGFFSDSTLSPRSRSTSPRRIILRWMELLLLCQNV